MKRIILPLADDEEVKVPKFENVNFDKIRTSDIGEVCIYKEKWFSEVGKLLWWRERQDFKFRHQPFFGYDYQNQTFGIIQNRRFFKNLNDLNVYSTNEVILAKKEWLTGPSIMTQFKICHPKYFEKFRKICKKINVKDEIINESYLCPHNIFLCKLNFIYEYCQFLKDFLVPFYDPNENEKVGAWIAERCLHIFAHTYFKVREEEIVTLPKL